MPQPPRTTLFPYTTLFRSPRKPSPARVMPFSRSVNAPSHSPAAGSPAALRSEEHTSELQSQFHLVCRLLLEKKKNRHHQLDENLNAQHLTLFEANQRAH